MNNFTTKLTSILTGALLALAAGCGGVEDDPQPDSYSYRTTSNVGDLSTWTIEGNQLAAEWHDIAPLTGDVEKTYQVQAVCGSVNDQFGYRTCLVDGDSVCVAGVDACGPDDGPKDGDTFSIFEVPGMALVVQSNDDQLHAGFAAGDCADIATDDYTFVNIGLGQNDVLGLFRADAAFSTVHHMDFGFTDDPDNRIAYKTNDPAGKLSGITAGACENGVRELYIDAVDETVRLMVTEAGHLIIDKPEGEGGMLAINSVNAASIDDFANKTWGGISFPDEGEPEFLRLTTGPAEGGRVQVTSLVMSVSGDMTPATPMYIHNGPDGPKLNETMVELGEAYAANQIVLDGDYTGGPSELPGAFEVSTPEDDATAVLGIGASVDGKAMLFGSVVNVWEENRNAVKGNFIIFEK